MNEEVLISIAGMLMIISITLGIPIVRGLVKRWEREGETRRVPSDVSRRLERIEQAIDAMAIEVERISEGQRFTTRLLSGRADGGATAGPAADVARPNQFVGESR